MTSAAVRTVSKGSMRSVISKAGGGSLKDDYIIELESRCITVTHRFEGHIYKFIKHRFNRRLNPVPSHIVPSGSPEDALCHLNNAFLVASATHNRSTTGRRRKISP